MHFNLPIVEVVQKKKSLSYNCQEVIMFLALNLFNDEFFREI